MPITDACPPTLSDERQPVIVAARRTPIGRAGGRLADVEVEDLAGVVLRAVVDEAGLDPDAIDDVILGNAANGGGNLARTALLAAGLPIGVPGMTIDRQCGAGLEAVVTACRLVAAGAGTVFIAGGVESVSRAPWRVEKPRSLQGLPRFYARARFAPDSVGDPDMGVAAETVAQRFGITRAAQDAFALESHRRAVAAQDGGRFTAEIVAVPTWQGLVTTDECPRRDTSAAALAKLTPAFVPGGTVTAGNACPLNDGAAALVVLSRGHGRRLGFHRGLGFLDAAAAGVDPKLLGIGPIESTRRLLRRRPDVGLDAVSVLEFNEAFASQVLASLTALEIDPAFVNRDGGALALGHPFGASGAILVTRLFSQMVRGGTVRQPDGIGLAMIGIGGGLGITAAFQALDL